jgi:hypothetical protein
MRQRLFSFYALGLILMVSPATLFAQVNYTGKSSNQDRMTAVKDGLVLTIQSASDTCSRPSYVSGKLVPAPGSGGLNGTYNGTMYRCTTTELVGKCKEPEFYSLSFTGTFTKIPAGGKDTIKLEVNYPAHIWNKTECKHEKTKAGSDVLILQAQSPTTSQPSVTGPLNDIIHGGMRGVLYGPSDHPLNPANAH